MITTTTATTWQPKRNGTWDRMLHRERAAWLASLSDWQLVEQAGVRARAAGKSIAQILTAWVLNGLMTYEHKLALALALDGLIGIAPAAFYDLARVDRFRAGLALAALGSDGRFAFAASCGELLGQLYSTDPIPAAVVESNWRRAGLLGKG